MKVRIKKPAYSLVLCDLSAAEVRTAANASGDPDMISAYQQGQDLYSLIASKIYNNNYEDNLEFYPEGTKIIFEGKEVITGDEKEYLIDYNDSLNGFEVPYYRLVLTSKGYIRASDLKVDDIIKTDEGVAKIDSISFIDELVKIKINKLIN